MTTVNIPGANPLSEISWIVFDVGRVIINIYPEQTISDFASLTGRSEEEIFLYLSKSQYGDHSSIFDAFSCGAKSEEQYISEIKKKKKKPVSASDLIKADQKTLGEDIESSVDILKSLYGKFNLACFSNTHAIHWNKLRSERDWFKYLSFVLASHEERLAKPDPRVFEYMNDLLKCTPKSCLFIDDMQENIQSAESCGWNAIHCTNPTDLPRQIREWIKE